MHVLIVDDDEGARYLAETIIKSEGHRVTTAVDGLDALECAREVVPDVVLSDILMPRMDGYQLVREWKKDVVLASIPLIFYTASYTDPEDERFALELGADRFVSKPAEPHELLGILAEVVGVTAEQGSPRSPLPVAEAEVLREYSERLVHKLEHKVLELERSNEMLSGAIEALNIEMEAKARLIAELHAEVEERRRAESAVRLQATALESAASGIVIANELGAVLWANSAFYQMLSGVGVTVAGMDLRGMLEVDGGLDPEIWDHAALGERWTGEILWELKGIEPLLLHIALAPVRDDDGISHIVVVAHDVSDRRRMEQMKSDFVAVVSHELRTPLTKIIGYADLLATVGPNAGASGSGVTVLDRVRESARDMQTLVESLLEVTEVQERGTDIDVAPQDVSLLIRQAIADVGDLESHAISSDIAADLPLVPVDAVRIAHVIRRLLDNAVKYSPDGGPISVRAWLEDGRVNVSVADHGVGIEPEQLHALFERFGQLDMSSTRRFGGMGVGLFLVREVMAAHRGNVVATSTVGEGSTFTISLPVEHDASA